MVFVEVVIVTLGEMLEMDVVDLCVEEVVSGETFMWIVDEGPVFGVDMMFMNIVGLMYVIVVFIVGGVLGVMAEVT